MGRFANIYDICDEVILKEKSRCEIGENLKRLYKTSVCNILLKTFILKGARHAEISLEKVDLYREMFRKAMGATYDDYKNKEWIKTTFKPIADLLDKVKNPVWQLREKIEVEKVNPSKEKIYHIIDETLKDVLGVWKKEMPDPFIPVAAQVPLRR